MVSKESITHVASILLMPCGRPLTHCVHVLTLCFLLTPGACVAVGGEFNATMNIGDAAPTWQSLAGVDGKQHTVESHSGQITVVVFTCNSCPYAIDMEDRLLALHAWCKDNEVLLYAINVNTIEDDALPMMKEKAAEKKFSFPYLYDPTQQIATDFGARYTPELFVIDRAGKIAYMGSLDDSPDGKVVSKTYVQDAVNALLSEKEVSPKETVPIGCRIRYARVRRTRK